jgi:tRNA 2-thiocytidine biosynthesis protein TtcA
MDTLIKEIQKPKGKEYYLSKKVGKAIMDYQMLSEGDRILVAVSGGKDSLTLLKILRDRLSISPVKYELIAVHIDMGKGCIHSEILKDYFEKNNYSYIIEKTDIFKDSINSKIDCFWCSWNRRKTIFKLADKLNCNKVALGHHLDDIVQTILLNLFFNGEISSMSPKQTLFEGKITIIRPLAYVEEKEIIRFAKEQDFPQPHCRCPNSFLSQRTYIKELIKELEKRVPDIKKNIFRALKRVKKEYLP